MIRWGRNGAASAQGKARSTGPSSHHRPFVVGLAWTSSNGNQHITLVVRGADNHLWQREFNSTSCAPVCNWGAWEDLGGTITADPSVVSWGAGRLDFFVRGTDLQMWQKSYVPGTGWVPSKTTYNPRGGTLRGGPDAASPGAGTLWVFVRDSGNNLWETYCATSPCTSSNQWSGFTVGFAAPPGGITSDPGPVTRAGDLDVNVRGPRITGIQDPKFRDGADVVAKSYAGCCGWNPGWFTHTDYRPY